MFNRGRFRILVLVLVLAVATAEDQCPLTKKDCECNFSSDAEDGGESMAADAASKSEVLAAAAGAMSPLLIGGAGMGIWKLLKRGGDDSVPGMDRQGSDLSQESSPPKYSSRSGSVVSVSEEVDTDKDTFTNTRTNRKWGSNPPPGPKPTTPVGDINSWMF
ncbi:uncharacterized protein LOC123545490 [Mercenaria mercenaria]|uniref:uncharacterized protein LOC123545490 n=1 Tax=Mercenaria mercenaria TaxID=6596 RepID=UPI001E1D256A|nr:uncharacterized protein LOC123545490 [Mercenaria mercenaria]